MDPCCPKFPKKCPLGPQNSSGSSGPEKLLKIVSCATIKETENAKRHNGGGPGGLGRSPPISTQINFGTVAEEGVAILQRVMYI